MKMHQNRHLFAYFGYHLKGFSLPWHCSHNVEVICTNSESGYLTSCIILLDYPHDEIGNWSLNLKTFSERKIQWSS